MPRREGGYRISGGDVNALQKDKLIPSLYDTATQAEVVLRKLPDKQKECSSIFRMKVSIIGVTAIA